MGSVRAYVLLVATIIGVAPAERYANLSVGARGKVTIITEDGRRIRPPIDDEQVGIQRWALAPDRESVGWLILYPFCCTAYPLPEKLVVFSNGQLHTFKGGFGEPIWRWRFQDRGKRVAFYEETPHGSQGLHYELWDVARGQRVAEYSPTYDENGRVIARPNEPSWVQALEAMR